MNLQGHVKRVHRDYVIKVLWMKGLTVGDLAQTVGASPGQVRGVVAKGFGSMPRSEMSLSERQRRLNDMQRLAPHGLDLPGSLFRARPAERLSDMARKPLRGGHELAEGFEQVTHEGRTIDVVRRRADGLEEARARGWLYEARTDGALAGIALIRLSAGQNLMRDFAMAMISSIGPQSFEPGTSGGQPKNLIADAALDGTARILALQAKVHVACWLLLCAVLRDGFTLADYARASRKPERAIRRLFRRSLDDVAVRYALLDEREYRKRWGYRRRPVDLARENVRSINLILASRKGLAS